MGLANITTQQQNDPEASRAMKNAILLKKLQAMPPAQRQQVISLAQQKRRARLQQQQGAPPAGLPQQQMPVRPQPQPQPRQPQRSATNLAAFQRLAQQQATPSLAQQLQQRPQIGR